MKRALTCALLALLTACSAASTSLLPHPTTAPHKVAFTITALGGTRTASLRAMSTGGCTVAPSTLALQAVPPSAPTQTATWDALGGYQIIATEYDANCNATNNVPTFTIAGPTIVSTTIPAYFQNVPTPPPGGIAVTGLSKGGTTIIATFPDGTTSTVTASVYGTLAVSCAAQEYYLYDGSSSYSDAGWSQTQGVIPSAELDACGSTRSNAITADIQVGNSGDILFPYGFDIIASGAPLGYDALNKLQGIKDCTQFVSQGTDLTAQTLQQTRIQVLLFKTSTGACVKFALAPNGEEATQYGGYSLYGYYAVTDSSGLFAY